MPAGRELVLSVAVFPTSGIFFPIVVFPSLKVTVPVGVPPELETVAVNCTDWPKVDGSRDEVMLVEVPYITV